jgi:5-(carboxyamino)imidazole ribonucleotide synthase
MSADQGQIIPPGSVIGLLGGGQLGRMAAMAAARLGYKTHVFCPPGDNPALQVASASTIAAYEDNAALARFAAAVDVVSFEFENVPSAAAQVLAAIKPARPSPRVLHICQDRLREKDFLATVKVPTTRYMEVARAESLERAVREIGYPAVLKSAQFGYDGRGQVRIGPETRLEEAWAQMGAPLGILEGYVDFRLELSVIAARTLDGSVATYAPVENQHRNHILDTTIVPARVKPEIAMRAEAIGQHVATELGLVGIVAVEMFVTQNDEVLVNELAPRPHNSGHWSIDGAVTSQFEQFVRAICGLPLGSAERHSDAVMKNLLGEDIESWRDILAEPAAKLHLYGKGHARPGRKMGHVTRLTPKR